jgi:hypothetical protein
LNGTGAADQAGTTAQALGGLGFDILGTGDATSVGQPSETLVTYAQRTPADEAAAQAVAATLSGAVMLDYGPTTDGAQVTVTTGTNFTVNPTATPVASTTTTTQGLAGSPASTTTTTPASSVFSAPSQSVEALQPWDPRSCTASGGEGS